jgi:hypothetical protein
MLNSILTRRRLPGGHGAQEADLPAVLGLVLRQVVKHPSGRDGSVHTRARPSPLLDSHSLQRGDEVAAHGVQAGEMVLGSLAAHPYQVALLVPHAVWQEVCDRRGEFPAAEEFDGQPLHFGRRDVIQERPDTVAARRRLPVKGRLVEARYGRPRAPTRVLKRGKPQGEFRRQPDWQRESQLTRRF